MRIAKTALISPRCNLVYGTFAVALSVFIFAYSTRFGQVSVLAYYGLWLPLVLVDYRRVVGNVAGYHWIVAFAVIACLSTFWSLAPGVSARAGIQYATHLFVALIASRVIGVRTMVLGLLAGTALVLAFSFAFGGYHFDPLDGTYSFVGAFSSKNQLGFFASLGVYAAFVTAFLLSVPFLVRAGALAVGLVASYALLASQSATSVIGIVLTLAAMVAMQFMLLFSPLARKVTFAVGLIIAAGVVAVGLNAGLLDAVLAVFGKDATLTGRTYLWSEGIASVSQAPILGVGYQGYWVQGFSEAERLWAEFYIATRTGFHFHNTYIEALVELGLVGFLLIVLLVGGVVLGHLGRLLARPRDGAAHILFGLAVLLLIRSFVEVDILYPYTIGSFLIYYAAGQIPVLAAEDRQAARRHEREGPADAARFRPAPRAVRID
jgi:exopolysaccharide production protein ExoQ